MTDTVNRLCADIVASCDTAKVILYGTKFTPDGKGIREVNLCLVVREDVKKAEAKLYRCLDSELVFNLLLYSEEDFNTHTTDATSYAHSIMTKGTVLYG
jgi:hypothetical protein